MSTTLPLPAAALCRLCDPEIFPFTTTAELEDLTEILGQERAVEALGFGIEIRHAGYNIFVLGSEGTGRHALVRRFLEQQASDDPVPDDWCYVHNFAIAERPTALHLPAGRGVKLREDAEHLIEHLRVAIPAAFDSQDYRTRRAALEEAHKERQSALFEAVRERAKSVGIAMVRTPTGIALAPLKGDEIMPPEEFEALPEDRKSALAAGIDAIHAEMERIVGEVPRWEKEHREAVRKLDQEVTDFAVRHLIEDLRTRWADQAAVLAWLDAVAGDVRLNAERFLPPMPQGVGLAMPRVLPEGMEEGDAFRRYRVNVLVDRDAQRGAPVVYEDQPTLPALVGRVDHLARFGALLTDFTLIRAGALHRANGGYLVLDARKVLMQPMAWESLKRALTAREIRIEGLGQALNLVSTVSLEPQPIPIDLKVALIGDRQLYYLLAEYDPEFLQLFKVPAEFEDRFDRTEADLLRFARLLATQARKDGLRPFHKGAVARLVAQAARLAEDRDKLTTHLHTLSDLLRQADHVARRAGAETVLSEHVERALQADEHRRASVRDRMHEAIQTGTVHVETTGAVVGQINGLAVWMLGGVSFGRPSRITAAVWPGRGRVIDIEREVNLGGPIHSKGVLILTGFLSARYGGHHPLALSASLVFEQSYGGVEGDSASLAETAALLSAIAGVPLRQDLAITGSMDQRGQSQAIGGVNEKIEGFYDVCKARGLTGTQGVIVPADNVRHLMLRPDVVTAAAEGRFNIYPVASIDEAISLLTGLRAGERGADGLYPEGSFNAAEERGLAALAEAAKRLGRMLSDEPEGAKTRR